MGQLTVQEATDRQGLRAFVDYPYAKYRNDPNWVAPLRVSQFEMFDESKNPFWHHAQKALYLARRDGRVVGRIAYIRDHVGAVLDAVDGAERGTSASARDGHLGEDLAGMDGF